MKIAKWDKWQSFRKDRGAPPWIKVHRNLFTNGEWVTLTDAEKGQLVSIWMLAADKGGQIPDDPRLIQRMAMLDDAPDINRFTTLGFLETNCQPDDNQMTTTCQPLDVNLTHQSRVDQSRVDQSRSVIPTLEETTAHFADKGSTTAEAEKYHDFYESKGWMVGKNKMKSWKSAANNWIRRNQDEKSKRSPSAIELATNNNW